MNKNKERIQSIVNQCNIPDKTFVLSEINGVLFLSLKYVEADVLDGKLVEWETRKWYLEDDATETDIVRTCFLAAQQSAMHQLGEHFTFNNFRVFSPHKALNELINVSEA